MKGGIKNTARPGRGWLTKTELAAALDISTHTFDVTYRRYANAEAVKDVDGKLFFHARSILDRWRETGPPVNAVKLPVEGEPDPLLQGPVTDALEYYREQRGKQEKLKLEVMLGNLVAIADIEPPLLNLCGMLRRAGETIVRKYGNDAGQPINEALDEFEKGCESVLQLSGKGGDDDRSDS